MENSAIIVKNSPINPLVPGNPIEAKTKNINTIEYFGILLTKPP